MPLAEMHIDHIIPSARGGPDREDNLQPSHKACNVAKGVKIPEGMEHLVTWRPSGWSINPKKLKHFRRFAPLTQVELATLSGVRAQTIHRIEAGKVKSAQPATIKKLAKALGVEPVSLMTEDAGEGEVQ